MFSFVRNLFTTSTLSLLVPETILVYFCYILAAYWWGGADPSVYLLYDNGLLQISIVVAGVLIGLQINKLYVQVGVRSKILLFQQLCLALGVTFLPRVAGQLCTPARFGIAALRDDAGQRLRPHHPAGLAHLLQFGVVEESGPEESSLLRKHSRGSGSGTQPGHAS